MPAIFFGSLGARVTHRHGLQGAAAPLRDPAETDETRPQGLEDAEHPRDPGAGGGIFGGQKKTRIYIDL